MAEQVQTTPTRRTREGSVEQTEEVVAKSETDTKLVDDIDALLDEIDDVLEENAVEFVSRYVQRGGQ